jgi:hypothetical protein
MRYADPFEALFSFQRALENRGSSDRFGNATGGTGLGCSARPVDARRFDDRHQLVALLEDGQGRHFSHRRAEERPASNATGLRSATIGAQLALYRDMRPW